MFLFAPDINSLPYRTLGWLDPHSDRIGNRHFARNTAEGLSMHLNDCPGSYVPETGQPRWEMTPEAVTAALGELVEAGLVTLGQDGTYTRTPAGDKTLGGTVYAEQSPVAAATTE